jgi:hypothetical protein
MAARHSTTQQAAPKPCLHLHLFLHAGARLPVVDEVAVRLTLAAPHSPPQLVQLGKAKALCGHAGSRVAWVAVWQGQQRQHDSKP